MRRGEILNLKWNQVRNGFIYLEKTKTKTTREIPVNDEFAQVLKEIRNEQGRGNVKSFVSQGKG